MSTYSIKKPITVLMGTLIIIVLGIFSVTRLPLTLFPDINLPFVVTITTFEGRTPEEVEVEVTKKIESTVATIGNFKEVTSMSNEHFGVSIISFADSTNMDSVIVEMRELLNNVSFVEGVGNVRILRISPDMLPVMTVTLFRTYDEDLTDEEILIRNTEWITHDIMLDLTSIPGVADVSITGQADVVLQVNLDETILTNYGLTHQEVLEIIERQNVGGLIGVALDDGELRMLYLGNKPSRLVDIETLPIINDGGVIVTLSELAVTDGIKYINANIDSYSKINGIQGIQISFQKQSDYGITEVTNNITTRLNEIINASEEDARYTVLLDQGQYINLAIGSVLQNIIIGGILAILILFFFLRNIKPTIIVGLAIPISVIASFTLMYFTDLSLNLVSMGGLALGIGMLVDNAIVVIENIFRMINQGIPKEKAAAEGAKQVAGAITASTLTTISVFLPIAFIEGMIADVFMSMALTIAFSLGASLLIALTLVPSMAAKMLDDKVQKKESKWIITLKRWYKKSVLFTLKYKVATLIMVLLLLGASFALVYGKGFILLPTSDEGNISVSIETRSQVEFTAKASFADQLTEELMTIEDIETISASISGSGSFGFMAMFRSSGAGEIRFSINLKENRTKTTAINAQLIETAIAGFDYSKVADFSENDIIEVVVSAQNNAAMLGGESGIVVKVSGYDLQTLEKIANDITEILLEVDGVVKADNGVSKGADNVKITVNRENAMLHYLTNQDVLDNIQFLYVNLENLGASQSLIIQIDGVDYTLDIPVETIGGGITFDVFGNYLDFFANLMLFDKPTRDLIDAFHTSSGMGIYTLNAVLPGYQPGDKIQFVINPYLKVTVDGIELNPFSADPTLASLALAPLYVSNDDTSVTTIERITGFATINTDGTSRYLNVRAEIESDKNITLVNQEATQAVNAYLASSEFTQYGSGYTVRFAGESENIMDAVSDLIIAALVAILLVYMVMAIQFQSLIHPLIILGTVPLAFTGGMLALLVTNNHLSIVSIMGLIILIGIIVNNGIVLIDFINKLREQGLTIKEAIIEAGETRLRPILMTALTTILALVMMAFGVGEGAELLQPMAITAIGGLIYATILTLVVVPTLYGLLNYKKMKQEETK